MRTTIAAAAALALLNAVPAAAQQKPLKIGFIATFSGPGAIIGQHLYDGFMLGVEQAGGKLGGVATEVIKEDDQLKPDIGLQAAQKLLEKDKVDIVQMRAAKPDALYVFYPGGFGITFLKQYAQAGLTTEIPMYSAFTVDTASLAAQGDAAIGTFQSAFWNVDLPNATNAKFVAAFEKKYGYVPS